MPVEAFDASNAPALSLCFGLIILIPLAVAGMAVISAGLSRSRSAAHTILMSMSAFAVAIVAYFACGFAIQGLASGTPRSVTLAGHVWNVVGGGSVFLAGFDFQNTRAALFLLFQLVSVGMTAAIPVAAASERWRIGAACVSTALLAGFVYPLFAHSVWSGGWLAQLGANCGLGRGFFDPAGASCIQATGGLTALAVAWILGSRHSKFTADGVPTAIPGHNAVVVLFGCLLAFVGWLGLNAAGAVLLAGAQFPQVIASAVNTTLCASSAAIAALSITRARFGKPDASLAANGWVSGLVASSGVCHLVKPVEAVIIGLVAGGLVIFCIEFVELRLRVDDPAGAISVHAGGGLWGVLSFGIFGRLPFASPSGDSGQFLAQLVGIATLVGFVLPLSYGLNWLLDRILRQRVAAEGERQGMDLFELGAGAYPDFMTHRDDFLRR